MVVLLAALAVVVAGCSSPSDTMAENLAESIDGVKDVDINSDTGEIKFETDDGSINIGGGEVPSDLFVPLPSGYDVQAVIQTDDGTSVSVAYDQGRYDELVSYFEDWTNSDSPDWEHGSLNMDQGGSSFRSDNWSMSDRGINLADCMTAASTDGKPNAACVIVISE
ncbi:MAG: hypothetical protein DWP92_10670 [Armatimonadetes bacterium]|nr:MAG: hypothetical protein DWP92_10670 [Armatimonadota bacterium]